MGRPKSIGTLHQEYKGLAGAYHRRLLQLGHAPESSRARYHYLCEFLHWLECQGHLQIETTTPKHITSYIRYISQRPSKNTGNLLAPGTVHDHMFIVRKLFMMLQGEGRIAQNPCDMLHWPCPAGTYGERAVLTQQEVQQLYQVAHTAQERAILSLAYGCGLRAGELARCNVEDVRLQEKILVVPRGKGNKRRVVPMGLKVVQDLSAYYEKERAAGTGERAFMLHSRGGRMQKGTYNRHLKLLVERTGDETIKAKDVTIHTLRHSIATHLLEQGVPVGQVRIFLGHGQLETTQLYTHIDQGQLKGLVQ